MRQGLRAFHAGLLRRDLRLSGLAAHLYHRTRKHLVDNPNDRIVEDTRRGRLIRCESGVEQYLEEFKRAPDDLRAANLPAPPRPPLPPGMLAVAHATST